MIEIDGRDYCDIGVHEVDGVEAPAQANFEHQRVELLTREEPQRRQRAELEVSERHRRVTWATDPCIFHGAKRSQQVVVRHERSRDAHAFIVASQMR